MNEINRLMDKFAKDYDDRDIDEIIAYVRKQLALYDSGVKPQKIAAEQVDMAAIVAKIAKTKPAAPVKKMTRRM